MFVRAAAGTLGAGLVCLVFAVAAVYLPPGAGVFPLVIGVLGTASAGLCMVLQWRHSRSNIPAQDPNPAPTDKSLEKAGGDGKLVIGVVCTCLYPLLIWLIGYACGTFAFTTVLSVWLGKPVWKVIVGFGVIVFLLWWVFAYALQLSLPTGVLWSLSR